MYKRHTDMSHLSVEAVAHSGRSHHPRLLITGKGNSSCDGILIKSTAASAPHPRAHGMNEDDKQGRVEEKCSQGTANRRPIL